MKRITSIFAAPLLAGLLLFSSFSPKEKKVIQNYAWYTPAGQFVAWSTLVNAEIVSGDNTNPVNGTLDLEGFTGGGAGLPPSGTLVYKLYSHP